MTRIIPRKRLCSCWRLTSEISPLISNSCPVGLFDLQGSLKCSPVKNKSSRPTLYGKYFYRKTVRYDTENWQLTKQVNKLNPFRNTNCPRRHYLVCSCGQSISFEVPSWWTQTTNPGGVKKVLKTSDFYDFAVGRCCFVLPYPLKTILLWVSVWVRWLIHVFWSCILTPKVRKTTVF